MRYKILLSLFVLLGLLGTASCGGGSETNKPATNAASNTGSNSKDPLATTKTRTEEVTNSAPTLTPVFKAYCDAWTKNDEAALRKVYSAETLRAFEADMKEEKTTSLLKFLEDDKVSGTPCEVANEQITGETGTATVKTNKAPNGVRLVFQRENGQWKLTNKIPEFDATKKTAGAANSTNSGK
jgi:hypothetical protein